MARAIGIRVHKGSELLETQLFERDIIKIGCLNSAHLRLEDPKVSRIHAVIDIAAGNEVSIIDMGSAEGTRVNGEKVSRVRLKHGDEVALGDSRLVIVLDEAEIASLRGAPPEPVLTSSAGVAVRPQASPFDIPVHTGVFTSGATDVSALRAELQATAAAPGSDVFQNSDAPASFEAVRTVQANALAQSAGEVTAPARQPPVAAPQSAARVAPAATPAAARPAPVSAKPVAAPAPMPAPKAAAAVLAPPVVAAPAAARRVAPAAALPMPALPPIPEDHITPENRFIEVTAKWGNDTMDCQRVKNVERFTIGRADTDNMFIPLEGAASGPSFVLLTSEKGGGWAVRFTSQMAGTVTRGDATRPLAQAGAIPDQDGFRLPITDDTFVQMSFGNFTVEVRPVAKSRIIPIAPFFDALWANTAVVTMLSTVAMLAVVTLLPVGLDSMEDDLLTNPSKFQTLILKPPPKDNSFLNKKGPKEKKQAAKDEVGKAGSKKAKPDEKGKMASKTKDKVTDEQVVANKLNALFGDKGSGGIAQLFGDATSGGALEAALGGIDGGKVGAAYGTGGLGLRGGGPGGGGTGINTLGTGKVGTRGRGSGEAGYGSGEGGLGGKADRDVTMTQGTPVVVGSLDKEIIRRIVQEHASQIRYCYEKELTRTPGIYGKIVMKWVIDGNGKVTQAVNAETQMKNANVEGCLATKIKTWVFPKPKGGGIVVVNYPFVFKQG